MDTGSSSLANCDDTTITLNQFFCDVCCRFKPDTMRVTLCPRCSYSCCYQCLQKVLQIEFWATIKLKLEKETCCKTSSCPACYGPFAWENILPPIAFPNVLRRYPLMLTPIFVRSSCIVYAPLTHQNDSQFICEGTFVALPLLLANIQCGETYSRYKLPTTEKMHLCDQQPLAEPFCNIEEPDCNIHRYSTLRDGNRYVYPKTFISQRDLTAEEETVVLEHVNEAHRVVETLFQQPLPDCVLFGDQLNGVNGIKETLERFRAKKFTRMRMRYSSENPGNLQQLNVLFDTLQSATNADTSIDGTSATAENDLSRIKVTKNAASKLRPLRHVNSRLEDMYEKAEHTNFGYLSSQTRFTAEHPWPSYWNTVTTTKLDLVCEPHYDDQATTALPYSTLSYNMRNNSRMSADGQDTEKATAFPAAPLTPVREVSERKALSRFQYNNQNTYHIQDAKTSEKFNELINRSCQSLYGESSTLPHFFYHNEAILPEPFDTMHHGCPKNISRGLRQTSDIIRATLTATNTTTKTPLTTSSKGSDEIIALGALEPAALSSAERAPHSIAAFGKQAARTQSESDTMCVGLLLNTSSSDSKNSEDVERNNNRTFKALEERLSPMQRFHVINDKQTRRSTLTSRGVSPEAVETSSIRRHRTSAEAAEHNARKQGLQTVPVSKRRHSSLLRHLLQNQWRSVHPKRAATPNTQTMLHNHCLSLGSTHTCCNFTKQRSMMNAPQSCPHSSRQKKRLYDSSTLERSAYPRALFRLCGVHGKQEATSEPCDIPLSNNDTSQRFPGEVATFGQGSEKLYNGSTKSSQTSSDNAAQSNTAAQCCTSFPLSPPYPEKQSAAYCNLADALHNALQPITTQSPAGTPRNALSNNSFAPFPVLDVPSASHYPLSSLEPLSQVDAPQKHEWNSMPNPPAFFSF